MFWSSPFSSFYGSLPDVLDPKSRKDDKDSDDANRTWTFGEKSPVKIEKKWLPASKPATPTSLRVVPRKKVSTPLRVNYILQSEDDDNGQFEYLARRPFPAETLNSMPAEVLLPGDEVRGDIMPSASESSYACAHENLSCDGPCEPVLDLCYPEREALPSNGVSFILSAPNSFILEKPGDASTVPYFVEAVPSPEISPFKTFATTKASLGYDVTKPGVSIPDVRRIDDSKFEDGNESEDCPEHEDAEKNAELVNSNGDYEEDMVLETDCESTSSVSECDLPAVFNFPGLSGLSASCEVDGEQGNGGGTEHDDVIDEDVVVETDITTPASRPTILRLNPTAPSFIPRSSFLSSPTPAPTPAPVPAPAAEVQFPSSVSKFHVDQVRHEDESTCDFLWPAETKDADDMAFLMYFGLLDLVSP